ncbi:hypothetical protein [Dongshaea marina]|uniref:hypothetical protein n=1 Tax=Dongshaea marina TaxID=2047966 RepID=UPI000D3ED77B|nr:hypothetical protein [Dongshaea marina]
MVYRLLRAVALCTLLSLLAACATVPPPPTPNQYGFQIKPLEQPVTNQSYQLLKMQLPLGHGLNPTLDLFMIEQDHDSKQSIAKRTQLYWNKVQAKGIQISRSKVMKELPNSVLMSFDATSGTQPFRGFVRGVQRGDNLYILMVMATARQWQHYGKTLLKSFNSFSPGESAPPQSGQLVFNKSKFSILPLGEAGEMQRFSPLLAMYLPHPDEFSSSSSLVVQGIKTPQSYADALVSEPVKVRDRVSQTIEQQLTQLAQQQQAKLGKFTLTNLNDHSFTLSYQQTRQGITTHYYLKMVISYFRMYMATASATDTHWPTEQQQIKASVDSLMMQG